MTKEATLTKRHMSSKIIQMIKKNLTRDIHWRGAIVLTTRDKGGYATRVQSNLYVILRGLTFILYLTFTLTSKGL